MLVNSPLSNILGYYSGEKDGAISPILFSSPHSGRFYAEDFLEKVALPFHILERMEDRFVDSFLADIPNFGDSVLSAEFPRSMCDVNRSWRELDYSLFSPPLRQEKLHITQKVRAGYGVIPRCTAPGCDIYRYPLPCEEADRRILSYWKPYHDLLSDVLSEKRRQHQYAVLFDIHSMPPLPQKKECHIVLGDCHGKSCSRALTEKLEAIFVQYGYYVQCNTPYAGGYITQHYGNPSKKYHALQIEICRSLYLNMNNLEPNHNFLKFKNDMNHILKEISLWCRETKALL